MTVRIGDKAPDFTLTNQFGQDVTLSSFRGERSAVVVFYPFAFSGVCSSELVDLRDNLADFPGDCEVLAVSCDPMFTLRTFADRDGFDFGLLSDFWPHGEVASAYDVFDAGRGCATRGTFVVDDRGTVRWTVSHELADPRDARWYIDAVKAISPVI